MSLTNFPNGISSFGFPVIPVTIPVSGVSKCYFVDNMRGGDGNSGLSPNKALKTLTAALAKCVSGNNDTVFLISDTNASTPTTTRLDETLVWDKDATHLIGLCAGGNIAQRARVATTLGTDFTPLVKMTASNCIFANVHFFHGYATASDQICFQLGDTTSSAQRNHFYNCHIAGGGAATSRDQTGMRSLKLLGSAENLFERCTIGLDTSPRNATNFEMEMVKNSTPTACTREIFRDCLFLTNRGSSGASGGYVTVTSSGSLDRFVLFDRCIFLNPTQSSATALTNAMTVASSAGGFVIIKDCTSAGSTNYAATSAQILIDGPVPNGDTTGLAVVINPT